MSIGLDPKSVKAHFFLGKAQSQMRLYEDAVATLTTGEYFTIQLQLISLKFMFRQPCIMII